MTRTDAQVARDVIVDELKTINRYEGLQDKADSKKVKDTVGDITREEKVHVGEAAALLRQNDKESMPALKEGARETEHIEESGKKTKQLQFNEYTGKLTDRPTNIKDFPHDKCPNWDYLPPETKKRLDPERYEREMHHKRASASFRDVFAQRRGEVIAKANGTSFAKYEPDRYYTNDDGEQVEIEGELPVEDDAEEFPEEKAHDAKKDLKNKRKGKNKDKKKPKVRNAGKNKDTTGYVDRDGSFGEGATVDRLPGQSDDPRLSGTGQDLNNKRIEEEYLQGMHTLLPREEVKGMDKRKNRIDQNLDKEKTLEGTYVTRDLRRDITDSGVPVRDAVMAGRDMDKELRRKKRTLDSAPPVKPYVEGYLGPMTESGPAADPAVQRFVEWSRLTPEELKAAVEEYLRKARLTRANNTKGKDRPGAKAMNHSIIAQNKDRNDMDVVDESVEEQKKNSGKKASASSVPTSSMHIEKGGRKNDSKKKWFKDNDRAVREKDPSRIRDVNQDRRDQGVRHKTPTGAYTSERRNPRNEEVMPSGILNVTSDPSEFDMDNYMAYVNRGGSRLPTGSITGENYKTLMGGTHQIVPVRRQVRDAYGNKVYDTRRVPVTDPEMPYKVEKVIGKDGKPVSKVVPNYLTDPNGNIVYTTESVPRMRTVGRTVLTKRGKDLAFLQRYTGGLDAEFDPDYGQWKPRGITLDKNGKVPKELFQDLVQEDGSIDPDEAMERLIEMGYTGRDNRYTPPDMEEYVNQFYRDAAYQILVDEGKLSSDGKVPGSNTPAGQEMIDELAAELRGADEEKARGFADRNSAERARASDLEMQIQDEAFERAYQMYRDWLQSAPYNVKDGVILRKVNGPDGVPFIQRVPLEKVNAWMDANTIALAEKARLETLWGQKDAAAKEGDEQARMHRNNRVLSDFVLRQAVEDLGHEPTPAELDELRLKADTLVEEMDPAEKQDMMDRLNAAYKGNTLANPEGDPLPGSDEDYTLARTRLTSDWNRARRTLDDPRLSPSEVYRHSFQRPIDLQRMREEHDRMRENAMDDRELLDIVHGIVNEAEDEANRDPYAHGLDMAISLMKDPRNRMLIDGNPKSGFRVRVNNLKEDEGKRAYIEYVINRALTEASDKGTLTDEMFRADPNGATLNALMDANKGIRNWHMYRVAEEHGYSPEELDEMRSDAGTADFIINGSGAKHNKLEDQDLFNMLARHLQRQNDYSLSNIMRDNKTLRQQFDEKNTQYTGSQEVDEAVYDQLLKEIKDNLRSGVKRRGLQESWGLDGLEALKQLAMMDPLKGGYDTLARLKDGALDPNVDPDIPTELGLALQKKIRRNIDRHNFNGIVEELLEENGDAIRDSLGLSTAIEGEVQAQQPQAEVKNPYVPTDWEARVKQILDSPKTPEERRLKTEMMRDMPLYQGLGYDDAKSISLLAQRLEKGKGKSLAPDVKLGSTQSYSSQTQDMHGKKPENVQDITQFEYETGYDPENILEGEAAEKRAKEIEETLAASEFNEMSGSQTGTPQPMSAEEIMADKKKHGTGHFNSGRPKGTTAGAPVDDPKPVRERPQKKTEEEKPKKPNEEVVGPTGKSVSFRDIYAVRRTKVLNKYHGI